MAMESSSFAWQIKHWLNLCWSVYQSAHCIKLWFRNHLYHLLTAKALTCCYGYSGLATLHQHGSRSNSGDQPDVVLNGWYQSVKSMRRNAVSQGLPFLKKYSAKEINKVALYTWFPASQNHFAMEISVCIWYPRKFNLSIWRQKHVK